MEIKLYEDLPQEAIMIREEVFMKEQGFKNEFEELDHHCFHLVALIDHHPVGTCRFFFDNELNSYVVGRIAVLKDYRKNHLGSAILARTEEEVRKRQGSSLYLHAQCTAVPFYEKQGFQAFGNIELDEGCPHTWMKKTL